MSESSESGLRAIMQNDTASKQAVQLRNIEKLARMNLESWLWSGQVLGVTAMPAMQGPRLRRSQTYVQGGYREKTGRH